MNGCAGFENDKEVEWNSLSVLSAKEKAELDAIETQTNATLVGIGVKSPEQLAKEIADANGEDYDSDAPGLDTDDDIDPDTDLDNEKNRIRRLVAEHQLKTKSINSIGPKKPMGILQRMRARMRVRDADFKESEHPRAPDGKFGNAAAASKTENPEKSTPKSISTSEILGERFDGIKGQDAIDKLMKEKHGYVPGAFIHKDIGDIDLIWGNDDIGLQHIIKRRKETNQPLGKLLNNISEVIQKGELTEQVNGRFALVYKGKTAVIKPTLNGHKIKFLFTAYYGK